jgi:Cu/Ag efflux protein CusF
MALLKEVLMLRTFLLALAALVLILPAGLQAKEKQAPASQTEDVAKQFETITAKVVKIDKATHTLTLLNDLQQRRSIQVDPNRVKNFDQIKVGDMVVVRQTQSLALTLTKHQKGEKPSAGAAMVTETASPGAKPGMETGKVVQISAEVVGINQANKTVDLKGPEGNTIRLAVRDASRLQNLKKGDMVAATYTKAMAISVEAAPQK